ncbi:hypothetical protein GmHk_06G017023 [Glycine max]|nr:hypothetical protein GmHk_06G017023 [Glycine max]
MQQPGAIEQPKAYAANIYNRPPQPHQQNQPQQNNYDLSSNRYNPGWRNHPNLRWSSPQQQQQQPAPSFQNAAGPSRPYIPPPIQQQQQPQKQPTSLTNLMGQLAIQLNQQQSQNFDKLPSQSVQNPKNVSAISLRLGKQCQGPQPIAPSSSVNELAKLHSTPEKGDDKNLPNNFCAGEFSIGNSNL